MQCQWSYEIFCFWVQIIPYLPNKEAGAHIPPASSMLFSTTRMYVARAMYVLNSYLQQGAVTALTRRWLIGLFLIGPGKPVWIHSPEAPDDDDNLILKCQHVIHLYNLIFFVSNHFQLWFVGP